MKNILVLTIALFVGYVAFAQQPLSEENAFRQANAVEKVSGKVIDVFTGQPLSNINISLKGIPWKGVITDENGEFELKTPSNNVVLLCSYPGYAIKEQPLFGRNQLLITLNPETGNISESDMGFNYFTRRENEFTGAVAIAKQNQSQLGENRSADHFLQRIASGVQSTFFSGMPGEGSQIQIRGIGTLFNRNTPLVVLDGFPLSNTINEESIVNGNIYNYLSDLNPKDIESVTVLKDAASIAMYGAQGSNGVILINTYSGTSGKTYLDFTMQTGVGTPWKDIPMMSGGDYKLYMQDKLFSTGLSFEQMQQRYPFFFATDNHTDTYWRYNNNTNWQDAIKQNSFTSDYHLSLRGGDGTSQYLFSAGYVNQEGELVGTDYSRINTRLNLDFKMMKFLSVGTRIYYSNTTKNLQDQGVVKDNNPLYLSLVKPSILSLRGKNYKGEDLPGYESYAFDGLNNPYGLVEQAHNEISNNWLVANVFVNVDLSKQLFLKLNMGYEWRNNDEKRFLPGKGREVDANGYTRISEQSFTGMNRIWLEPAANYSHAFGLDHHLVVVAGANLTQEKSKWDYGMVVNAPSDDFTSLADGTKINADGYKRNIHSMAGFVHGDYDFRNKYFLTAGVRAEASSLYSGLESASFSLGNQPVAILPYAGVAWKINSESFLNQIEKLNELKLRASIGQNTNQSVDLNRGVLYSAKYIIGGPGLVLSSIANKDIKWETTLKTNVGLDAVLFNYKLKLSLDLFKHQVDDMLVPQAIAGNQGFESYWTNGGSMEVKGYEISLGTQGQSNKLGWDVMLNVSTDRNKITSLPNDGRPIINNYYGFLSIAEVGQPAGLFYGYKTLGVFSTKAEAEQANLMGNNGARFAAGEFHYEDVNGDRRIDDLDCQVIGDPNPDFYGNLSGRITYGNLELNAVVNFCYGNDVMNVTRSRIEIPVGYENLSRAALGRWKAEGDNALIPFTQFGDRQELSRPSSQWVEDGSYVKLRSVGLAYNLNKHYAFIRYIRFFTNVYNLFTVSDYIGFDPEVRAGTSPFTQGYDFGNVPLARSFVLGIKFGL